MKKVQEVELHIGIEEYIEHLEAVGKKPSTVGTAKRTLALFEEGLGAKKVIAKIMPVHVAGFFKSEAATTLKEKPRAKASILQIRRIVRGALVFWHEQSYLASVPVPKEDKRFVKDGNSDKKKAKAQAAPQSEAAQQADETTEAQPEAAAPATEDKE